VARPANVPTQLRRKPFSVAEALKAGVKPWRLEGASWKRLGPSTYVWAGLAADPMHQLEAALRRLPFGAAFSGLTAAWLHGLDVAPCNPIEATVPEGAGVSARSGISLRRSDLPKGHVVTLRGLPATSMARTLGDLCARLSLTEAVVITDAALHSRRIQLDRLARWALENAGRRGMPKLRKVVGLAEPAAESPMESRLRMVIVQAGLPRPRAQVAIHDRWGRFVGRPDLYYERQKLGIEYDGGTHRDALVEDNRRQNRLLDAGVRLLRFTGPDVLGQPDRIVMEVRNALAMPPAVFANSAGGNG
jgi:very-short-patch-repair endonuclease